MKKYMNEDILILIKKILKLVYFILIIFSVLGICHIFRSYGIDSLLCQILKIVTPFVIGFIIAWLLKPILDKLKVFKIPNVLGCILIYTFFFLLIFLLIKFIIPNTYHELGNMKDIIDNSIKELNIILLKVFKNEAYVAKINKFLVSFMASYKPNMIEFTTSCINVFIQGLMGLVIGLYTLINYDEMNAFFLSLFKIKHQDFISNLISKISHTARQCVRGSLIVSFLVFVSSFMVFSFLHIPHAFVYALFCGITDIIPYLGPYIGGIPVTLVAFSVSSKLGFMTIIGCILVQNLENYFYGPIILSKEAKLNPVLIIFGLLLFGNLFGIIGLIIATPIMSILRVIIIEYQLFINNR